MVIQQTIDGKSHVNTGKFTGRSPKDRFIVLDETTQNSVEWNKVNQPISSDIFSQIKEKYIHSESFVYTLNREVGYVDFILHTSDPGAKQFFLNMTSPVSHIGQPWFIYHLPEVDCEFTPNPNCTILNFLSKEIIICGSAYTGEIKKGMFSVLNFTLPNQGVLPMHCSANAGTKDGKDVALFFGLSGTGKTTLSSDPNRFFIGDDEHGWRADNTVFNFEGGCYAKVINHNPEKEPVIDSAINKERALFENVVLKEGHIDYDDDTITPNTRVSYPLKNIDQSVMVDPIRQGTEVKNIFLLSYDAYGVLPPIMKLSDPNVAKEYFEIGYTSKVAGTEVGINEPQVVFSPCFGAPFFPRPIKEYANMFFNLIQKYDVNVWMINTGLNGKGNRYDINFTRDLINLVLNKDYSPEGIDSEFKGTIPKRMGSHTTELLPELSWGNKTEYITKVNILKEKLNR